MTPPTDDELRDILTGTKVVALVGFSANPERPSHRVARYLQRAGYRVIPVNPGLAGQVHLGETVWPDLAAIPKEAGVDMVDIFRRSEAVPALVEEALAALPGLRTIGMQLGVMHEGAAARARARGLRVVQDRCPAIERPRLVG